MKLRDSVPLLLILPAAIVVGQTSGTLKLDAVFQKPVAANAPGDNAGPKVSWKTFDPDGPAIEYPSPGLFSSGPQPTPTPVPSPTPEPMMEFDGKPIPDLPARGTAFKNARQVASQPLLKERGQESLMPDGLAMVTIKSEFTELIVEVVLAPSNPGDGESRLILSPESVDTFTLPAGEYSGEMTIWHPMLDSTSVVAHKPQDLKGGWRYELELSPLMEKGHRRLLDRK